MFLNISAELFIIRSMLNLTNVKIVGKQVASYLSNVSMGILNNFISHQKGNYQVTMIIVLMAGLVTLIMWVWLICDMLYPCTRHTKPCVEIINHV